MDKRDLFDLDTWSEAPTWEETDIVQVPGLKSIFYDSVPYRGRPTKAFAFIGVPDGEPGQTFPAVVLVHGGLGTAFYNWVQLWNSRGYVAIAMDTCGCVPDVTKDHRGRDWPAHEFAGPGNWGAEDRKNNVPPRDTWMYHATAQVIMAHSLLRSLPQVDETAIGITGVSWGGVLTCLAASLDQRFAWAAPVYGCGFRDPDRMVYDPELFDPSEYLRYATAPFFYLNGTNDFTFHLDNWHRSLQENAGPVRACLRVNMVHGHGEVSENPPEILDFAESVRLGRELPPKLSSPRISGQTAYVPFETTREVSRAELSFTTDSGPWSDREWNTRAADIDGNTVRAPLPDRTQAFFFSLYDKNGLQHLLGINLQNGIADADA